MKEYEELLEADTERFVKQSVPLVMGHLIRITCTRAGTPESAEQKRCFKEFAGGYVQKMYQKLSGENFNHPIRRTAKSGFQLSFSIELQRPPVARRRA